MFKSFVALIRGHSNDTAQAVVDRNAMVILRQQIRDCADAVTAARKAVAIAVAQNDQEVRQHEKLTARINDLEQRTVAAIEHGQQELASEAAETLSILESERDASEQAQKSFQTEIGRLKSIVQQSEARLRELKRGQRIADATDKTQRLRQATPGTGLSALKDAEETLTRLRDRQKQMDAASNALDEMSVNADPVHISEKLAEAGCGAPIKSSTQEILDRLAKKAKKQAKAGK